MLDLSEKNHQGSRFWSGLIIIIQLSAALARGRHACTVAVPLTTVVSLFTHYGPGAKSSCIPPSMFIWSTHHLFNNGQYQGQYLRACLFLVQVQLCVKSFPGSQHNSDHFSHTSWHTSFKIFGLRNSVLNRLDWSNGWKRGNRRAQGNFLAGRVGSTAAWHPTSQDLLLQPTLPSTPEICTIALYHYSYVIVHLVPVTASYRLASLDVLQGAVQLVPWLGYVLLHRRSC